MASTRQRGSAKQWLPGLKSTALTLSLIASAYLTAQCVGSARHVWVGWISLVPLLFSIRLLDPLRALLGGLLWGISLFGFSTALAAESNVTATWLSFFLLTLVPGIYTGLGAWCTRLAGFQPLVLGFGWMGVELALHPLGLNRGLLAGTFGDGWFIQVVGNLLGYVFAAFLVVLIGASLTSLLLSPHLGGITRSSLDDLQDAIRATRSQQCTYFWVLGVHPGAPRAPPP